MTASYPGDRQGCGYAIRYLRWLCESGTVNEIGPDAFAVLAAVVLMEDSIHYSRAPNFFNEQLLARCGIQSEHALIRARNRAVEAGLLAYLPGAKRRPGVYFTCGFTDERAAKESSFTAQRAANPKRIRNESETNPSPSKPYTHTHTHTRAGAHAKPKKSKTFQPPTLEEVQEYIRAQGFRIDAQQWHDYYAARGWMLGRGQPMRDWRAAVRTWQRNGINRANGHAVEPVYRDLSRPRTEALP